MKVCNFLGKFFLFLSFSFISFFNLSASCIKVEDTSFVFLSQDGNECIDKSGTGILTIPNGGVNNFDVLIPGKNDGGYTVELVFDRAGQSSISGEQSLFAFYDSKDNPVSELVLKGSSIFYKVNNTENEGIDLSKDLNDPNIVNPHAIIVVHDNIKDQLILNIDGAELEIENVPSINASDIKNVKIGKNYVGNIGEFRVYGTELSINERAGAVKLLSGMTDAKISAIELVKDKNGVTRSAINKDVLVKCKAGQSIINGNCNNAVISGFTPLPNTIYSGGSDIQYDPVHDGKENANILECKPGYEKGSTPPKYWFVLDGDVPSVYTEGSCDIKTYILGQDGNDPLPGNAKDPGAFTSVSLVGFNAANPKSIRCNTRHSAEGNLGVYLENDVLKAQGSCKYSSSNSPDCYNSSLNPVGSIATSGGCSGMLVVDRAMLQSAISDGSFDFKTSDIYTSHTDQTYSFNEIFTGQVTNMGSMFDGSAFNHPLNWDTSSVTNMSYMFRDSPFNHPINWDTGNVTNMSHMFVGSAFNHPLNWDTSSVTNMSGMFAHNKAFNHPLNWDTISVTNMGSMFEDSAFNNDISSWKTGSVTSMYRMFVRSAFNGDISSWDTSNVIDMSAMFRVASSFNQDISGWCVKNVTNKQEFKYLSGLQEEYSPPFDTTTNCN
jgi:surface protein